MTPIPAGWKLVEALRESLLWTASSLAAVGKEQDVITLEGRKRTIGEILDEANAALDSSPASVAPGDAQAVAWMDPSTMDVVSARRKASWLTEYGAGGVARAATYTRPLGDLHPAPAAGDALDLLRLRRIAWLIGSIFVHGDFKAETVNERELEKLLRENGTFWDSLAQFDAALAAQLPQQGEA